ncbi:MAG: hypothetical protein ACK5O2_00785 [Microthrixaceae bacterium]
MSVFTAYSAASERHTAIHRHEAIDALDAVYPLVCVPVSGDMLAVLTRGTRREAARRRRIALTAAREAGR